MSASRDRVLVWDLPVRIFHWLLAASFLAAWGIAVTVDDESRLFALHAVLGLFIGALVVFRIVWGLVGTRHARFGAFVYAPSGLRAYLAGLLGGREKEFVGHNPASAYATWAIGILLVGQIATGLLLGSGKESVEEVHEVLAHSVFAVAVLHVLGVALHTVRRRDPIALGMIDGRKRGVETAAIRSARPVSALVLVVLLAGWGGALWRGWDPARRTITLPVLGATVSVAEHDEHGDEHRGSRHDREQDDEDDD